MSIWSLWQSDNTKKVWSQCYSSLKNNECHSYLNISKVIFDSSLRDDGAVTVINRGRDTNNNKWKGSTGKVSFVNSADTEALQISFSRSFCGDYNLIKFDDNYRYSL
ncbi:lipocalin family protein [Morganella morganii]|nr:lipocalin family protein [Morganella morganii]